MQDLLGTLHDLHQLTDCAVPPASEPARSEARRLELVFRRKWLKTGLEKKLVSAAQR
jgi:hypothetical protein